MPRNWIGVRIAKVDNVHRRFPIKKIALIFGTRPEAIKLCPLALALRRHGRFTPQVCVTAQHRELLDQVLEAFGVEPEVDLDVMRPNQTLPELTARVVTRLDEYLAAHRPDLVIIQGDTTTVFCAALCAYYRKIPVAHVEAGLRSGNKYAPFPEEINRVLASHLADLHFAPTATARDNLLREGVPPEQIYVTGNTVIDALLLAVEKVRAAPPAVPGLPPALQPAACGPQSPRVVLITGHRRENFGQGFENICQAIARLAELFPHVHFVYPVHLNPNVRQPVGRILGQLSTRNVWLLEPLAYLPFVAMMDRSTLVLTDSGGIQEEAPSLGKPVLVMRDVTERPEAVQLGTVKLVGTDQQAIVDNVSRLLTDAEAYRAMARQVNPYGDGRACQRIVAILERFFAEHA